MALFSQGERLANFNAVRIDRNNIDIRWTMKAGVSCQSPQVQRSTNGQSFTTIYTFPGVCGGGQTEEDFNWIDQNPVQVGDSYYRLRIDDGEFSVIDLVAADLVLIDEDIRLFPNPSKEHFFVHFDPDLGTIERVAIYSLLGNEQFQLNKNQYNLKRGELELTIQLPSKTMYLLSVLFENGNERQLKFLVR